MNQTVIISEKTIDRIFARLNSLAKELKVIKTKLFKEDFRQGSDKWWEKEIEEAENEFKKGKGVLFKSSQNAIKWLNS